MKSNPKTIFISDLHLEENRPDITQKFILLLSQCHTSVDAIYILGDLFEVWIGDDENTLFHREIKQALRKVTQKGVPIYLMYGNRDFLIGKKFLSETGCTLLSDEEAIFLYGTRALLMHGDTLCTHDIAYMKVRKLARNRFIQFLFLLMPLALRKKYANKMRAKSKNHTQTASQEIMDVTQAEVEKIMRKYQANHLIHGHTHLPHTHHFLLDNAPAERVVLGAWHEGVYAVEWRGNGEKVIIRDSKYSL